MIKLPRVREGKHAFQPSSHVAAHPRVEPVTEYAHGPEGCSITGGYVYHGVDPGLASIAGAYVFGDYCSHTIWTYDAANGRRVLVQDSGADISSMGLGPDGTIYVLALGVQSDPVGGWVGRLVG